MMRSAIFLPLALLLSAGSNLGAQNVFLFTIDSCRADRFGIYGHDQDTTPHIDRWARTGTVFANAYSTTAWTAPGLVSILTGLYPPVHGVNNRDRMGPPELVTLPKLFASRGYLVPNLNFFTFAPYYAHLGLPEIQREYFGEEEGVELIRWLEEKAEPGGPPFFLWYHTTLVHQPYHPGEENLPAPLHTLRERPGIRAAMTGAIVPVGSTQFEPQDRSLLNLLYDAEVRRADRLFGQALQQLEKKGLLKNTLVILAADHGEELLEHGFIGHASTSLQAKLYEECIRIPLILSWPGRVPEGKRVLEPVNQTDIVPTIARLLDLEISVPLQGTDLFEASAERPLFFESVIAGNQTTREKEHLWVRGIRQGKYKYLSSGELYDLEADPGEKHNLLDERPKLAHRLETRLAEWLKESEELHHRLFPSQARRFSSAGASQCPRVFTPQSRSTLDYDVHTGMVLFDWSGDMETTYLIEYDIGQGDHHVAGTYEVQGNHQLLGPFPRELWTSLKAWNPFRFRVSPKVEPPCWSEWVQFHF